ncbi:HAD-IIB family hydrolase [Mucilaginibacter sp. UR6-11]|uniref:HAD-IIB family hydrolase n=1 Tax=Mucilaginibacter sp. UR6-11 TaxID=1435644 RepID=UPI001E3B2B7B|nr:HAD-IIB family hydrolase [Mucilaginibacter sp. UR6-11]MCC8423455.1 HAD-IIB family hydrolase [Mucilaginibacter sp. UR6-11]
MKKLVVFDLDGTLAESKAPIDREMIKILNALIDIVKVAIISGGDWPQFEKQVLSNLTNKKSFKNLFILPTCGTKFYQYKSGWKKLYSEDFTAEEKKKIIASLNAAVEQQGFKPERTWGDQIEDRGSQITFSALGQEAPLEAKKAWDPGFAKRKKIQTVLGKTIPEFSVNLGGTTSVDITKPGIDKAYGIKKLKEILNIKKREMIFIGDAIFPGGNDYPARETGVASVCIKDPNETKRVIEGIIACLDTKGKYDNSF